MEKFGFSIPGKGKRFWPSPLSIDRDGTHPASYPVRTKSLLPGGEAAGPLGWPVTSTSCRSYEWIKQYHTPQILHKNLSLTAEFAWHLILAGSLRIVTFVPLLEQQSQSFKAKIRKRKKIK